MWLIPDLQLLTSSNVTDSRGTVRPLLEVKVRPAEFSQLEKLGFDYAVLNMTRRTLELQLTFENPWYISMSGETEVLEVTINSGVPFFSLQAIQIELPEIHEMSRRQLWGEFDDAQDHYVVLTKQIPKQLPGAAHQEAA